MPKPKTDRVTIRANDAIIAFQALRTSIENLDAVVERQPADTQLSEIRQEKLEAYKRIAKVLGLKPAISIGG